ncbi:MAG TPA: acyl-CoA reductase [Candidatus Binataceae bacterium]|nr:acyl-CoA reductase [Candidatus Binataceae bacterium]
MSEAAQLTGAVEAAQLRETIARLRQSLVSFPGAMRVADSLGSAFARWRERTLPERRAALARIAASSGWSLGLLDESIDALLAPFTRDALESFASKITTRHRLGGFIMPANVAGAGMHELVVALISGVSAIVKTSNRARGIFHEFAHTLREIDLRVGGMLEVVTFSRERRDLSDLMQRECDFIVALGEDASLASLGGPARIFGFGSRVSGALISLTAPSNLTSLAAAIALDVTLFEQQGCLSPHHIFVEDTGGGSAREFALVLAGALDSLAAVLTTTKLSLHTAASIRRIRERARWREIGGRGVELHEDAAMVWTVVFDPSARFMLSPGHRCVTVTPIRDPADFELKLAPVKGRLEAFALAAARHSRAIYLDVLAGAGVTYVCDPGSMQSPPLMWPHGGGAFLDFVSTHS